MYAKKGYTYVQKSSQGEKQANPYHLNLMDVLPFNFVSIHQLLLSKY